MNGESKIEMVRMAVLALGLTLVVAAMAGVAELALVYILIVFARSAGFNG